MDNEDRINEIEKHLELAKNKKDAFIELVRTGIMVDLIRAKSYIKREFVLGLVERAMAVPLLNIWHCPEIPARMACDFIDHFCNKEFTKQLEWLPKELDYSITEF